MRVEFRIGDLASGYKSLKIIGAKGQRGQSLGVFREFQISRCCKLPAFPFSLGIRVKLKDISFEHDSRLPTICLVK
jgi:hypothetical protein